MKRTEPDDEVCNKAQAEKGKEQAAGDQQTAFVYAFRLQHVHEFVHGEVAH